jgi:RNA polymerase-associated protein
MMTLYSGSTCPRSHRCRIVLFEKGMDFHVEHIDSPQKSEDLAVISPYNEVPVLVERDLVLYEANIINEYIDDRFPHPQLMPPDPAMRARARLMLLQFERDLFCHVDDLEAENDSAPMARRAVADGLAQLTPVFTRNRFLLGDDMSMLDIAIAPLLWRLPRYGVNCGRDTAAMGGYFQRLFDRPAFQDATTPAEKAMRR